MNNKESIDNRKSLEVITDDDGRRQVSIIRAPDSEALKLINNGPSDYMLKKIINRIKSHKLNAFLFTNIVKLDRMLENLYWKTIEIEDYRRLDITEYAEVEVIDVIISLQNFLCDIIMDQTKTEDYYELKDALYDISFIFNFRHESDYKENKYFLLAEDFYKDMGLENVNDIEPLDSISDEVLNLLQTIRVMIWLFNEYNIDYYEGTNIEYDENENSPFDTSPDIPISSIFPVYMDML